MESTALFNEKNSLSYEEKTLPKTTLQLFLPKNGDHSFMLFFCISSFSRNSRAKAFEFKFESRVCYVT